MLTSQHNVTEVGQLWKLESIGILHDEKETPDADRLVIYQNLHYSFRWPGNLRTIFTYKLHTNTHSEQNKVLSREQEMLMTAISL